jgi:hypothetical protein
VSAETHNEQVPVTIYVNLLWVVPSASERDAVQLGYKVGAASWKFGMQEVPDIQTHRHLHLTPSERLVGQAVSAGRQLSPLIFDHEQV